MEIFLLLITASPCSKQFMFIVNLIVICTERNKNQNLINRIIRKSSTLLKCITKQSLNNMNIDQNLQAESSLASVNSN